MAAIPAESSRSRARQLLGMQPQSQAVAARGDEDNLRLLDAEEARIAEDVAEAGERRGRRDHLLDHLLHELVSRLPSRHGVRAKEGAHEPHRRIGGAQEPECAELIGHREPVAGLRLDRRRPPGQGMAQALAEQLSQLFVRGGPGCSDGAQDAAAVVWRPSKSGGCLVGSVAGVDGVGVGIHQAGRHERAAELNVGVRPRRVVPQSDPLDAPGIDKNRPWREDARLVGPGRLGDAQPAASGEEQPAVDHRR
jgi:hypothetical protein